MTTVQRDWLFIGIIALSMLLGSVLMHGLTP
jgi:hypothetical protein